MIWELSDEYIPEEVLHRDKQMGEIRKVFSSFKNFDSGTNLIIFGVTGSGKTTSIKKIIKEENKSVYISCAETKTPHKTIQAIFKLKIKTSEELLNKTIEKLKKEPRIIIIDEVDKVTNFTQLMNDLNTIYRKTMIPIILLTLKRDLLEEMPSDARKTLFFEKVTLPSYNATELRDILVSRIKSIKSRGITISDMDDGVINHISAIASQQGSARILMNITLRCIQKNNFSHDFIQDIYNDLLKDDWLDFVNDINNTEKEFLKILLYRCSGKTEVTAEILEKDMGGLSGARISQIINIFEKYSVITSRHENLGRAGGRRRLIKFCSEEVYLELKKAMGVE